MKAFSQAIDILDDGKTENKMRDKRKNRREKNVRKSHHGEEYYYLRRADYDLFAQQQLEATRKGKQESHRRRRSATLDTTRAGVTLTASRASARSYPSLYEIGGSESALRLV